MAGETILTMAGNLTRDPELRFTAQGAAVASFTIASTPRTFDRQTNDWKDGDTLFMGVSVWRQQAENVAETLTKGARVIVTGRLTQRTYTTKEGQDRTVLELIADEVAVSLRNASAKVTKTTRQTTGSSSGGRPQQPPADPWATSAAAHAGGSDDPPF